MCSYSFDVFARRIRFDVLKMVYKSKSSHIGSCFSIADVLLVLYLKILKINVGEFCNRTSDNCVISKGHAAAVVYAILARIGFFDKSKLSTFCESGSFLTGHVNYKVRGVGYSSGSLGHGLSVACGMALAQKKDRTKNKTYVVIGDGDLNEGSTWEGIMFAAHHNLSNLVMIIDYNKSQSLGASKDILNLEPLGKKFKSFDWKVEEVDGHDHTKIENSLNLLHSSNSRRPKVLIAHTIKGKGVSFMENELLWHYRNPDEALYEKAYNELILDNENYFN